MPRIASLDGLRGLAILLVGLFHAYARWPALVPYGAVYRDVALFRHGWLGVELFFMISGFVIAMSLRNCRHFIDFLARRWLRLFPAMLLCSLVIAGGAWLFPAIFVRRPAGAFVGLNLLPGLLLLDAETVSALIGLRVEPLEGAFWSLFVEVKFYAVFGLAFFLGGEAAAVAVICALALTAAAAQGFGLSEMVAVSRRTGFVFFSWMALGILAYRRHCGPARPTEGLLLAAMASSGLYLQCPDLDSTLYALTLIAIFFANLRYSTVRRFLANPVLLFLGYISYPFYLLHENMTIALTASLPRLPRWIPELVAPFPALLTVATLAFVVARFGEAPLRGRLRPIVDRVKSALGATEG